MFVAGMAVWSAMVTATRRDCGCRYVKPLLIHSVGWTEPCRVHAATGPPDLDVPPPSRPTSTTLPCPGCGKPVVRVDTVPPSARPPADHTVTGPLAFTCPGLNPSATGTIYTVEVQWE